MKKILPIALIMFNTIIFAQQKNDTIQKICIMKQPYNGANGAITWGIVGVSAMVIGGSAQFIAANPNVPLPNLFGNKKFFNEEIFYNETAQKPLHAIFGVGVGIASFAVLMVSHDLIYYKIHKNDKVALNLKVSPTSVGLRLNFK